MRTKNYAWGTSQRKTVQYVFHSATKREPYPVSADTLQSLRFDRTTWRWGRKPNRIAVGTIRAMGARNFFRGTYIGAEND